MDIIKGADQINKAIASIKNRGAKLDADIQGAALAVISHASEHGDTTLASRLVDAMPKGGRKLALVEWMLAFGQIRKLNPKNPDEAKRLKAGEHFTLDRSRTLDLESAMAKPWTEFKKEAAVSSAFDAQAAVKGLLSRFKAATANGLMVQNREQALAEARALVALLQTEPPADALV